MQIQIESINYYVEIVGNGPAIVLLHGFSENIRTWNYCDLPGYTMYKIDLVGHGLSDKPSKKEYYKIETIARHLHLLIEKLLPGNYVLLGYSFGGRVALMYALRYGKNKKISSLVLESSSYGIERKEDREDRYRKDVQLAEKVKKNDIAWFEYYWSNISMFDSQKKLCVEKSELIKSMRLSNDTRALSKILRYCGQGTMLCLKEQIHLLTFPILYISGELDQKYTVIGEKLALKQNNIQHVIVEKSGHNIHIEQPSRFNSVVKKFIEKSEYE